MTDYLTLAEQALKKGDASKWDACIYLSEIVGKYEKGVVQDFANRVGYDVSRLSDFAAAGTSWKVLKSHITEKERNCFKTDTFTHANKLLEHHPPDEVAQVLKDILEVSPKPTLSKAKELLDGHFGIVPKEVVPLKQIEHLESWGEKKLEIVDKAAWGACTKTLRSILKKYCV